MVSSSFLPPGYNFCPTDGDLIGHDLHNKVFGLPLSSDIVKDCDLYGSREPWEIREFYRGEKGEDLYIFTPLKKKSSKRKRICRKVGWGAWQGEDVAQEIQDNRVTGHKKRFRNDKLARKRHLGKKRKCHEVEHTDENHQSNKCFNVQNEQLNKGLNTKPCHPFTKDAAANLTITEALFPGLGTDNESANLGDLFPLDEQVQSAYSEKLSFSIETYASIDDEFSFHQGQEFFSSVFQLLSEPSSDYDFQIYSSYANEVTETEQLQLFIVSISLLVKTAELGS
ncbi:hypothetical protein Patl1_37082 [Pistacia atlantica]|nr:hypothetical protein Patl1_37082 [Pistacia atlantica]